MRISGFYLLGFALLASCASEREVTYSKAEATGLAKYQSDVSYMMDEAGNVQPTNSDQRSQFESEGNYYQAQSQMDSQYSKPEYSASRWEQNTSFSKKAYGSGKQSRDYKNSPYFVQQQAAYQGSQASVSGNQQFTGTSRYSGTSSQSYSNSGSVNKPTDAATAKRRNSLPAPDIYTLGEINQLNVEDTNEMLGR